MGLKKGNRGSELEGGWEEWHVVDDDEVIPDILKEDKGQVVDFSTSRIQDQDSGSLEHVPVNSENLIPDRDINVSRKVCA